MENYEVTIGYRAVITVSVKSDTKEDAEKEAIKIFENKERIKWFKTQKCNLQDDSYSAEGVINMDKTWNQL